MSRVSKISHLGKEILFVDLNGLKIETEMIAVLKEAQKIIIEGNKPYLQLTDLRNSYVSPIYMAEAKKIAKETPKLATKRAMVGIESPARRILLHAYNLILGKNPIKPFDTLEDAKNWLVS